MEESREENVAFSACGSPGDDEIVVDFVSCIVLTLSEVTRGLE